MKVDFLLRSISSIKLIEIFIKYGFFSWILATICCKQEAPAVVYDSTKVEGNWLVTEALRNNKHTQTLNGAEFNISKDHLTHNLYGADSSYLIQWGQGYIYAPRDTFRIESIVDSFMVLQVLLQQHNFKFSLKKQTDQTEISNEIDTVGLN